MAVSIEDAWNLSSVVEPQKKSTKVDNFINENGISARQSILPEKDTDLDIMLTSTEEMQNEKKDLLSLDLEPLIVQFQELRKEESKRFTVYLTISGIMFALLFMYIERLQNRIGMLSRKIRPPQVVRNTPSHEMIPQPSQLYSWLH